MRLVTFQRNQIHTPEPGLVHGNEIISLLPLGYHSLLEVIEQGLTVLPNLQAHAEQAPESARTPMGSAQLLAPIPRPPKIICVGLNYRDHAEESKMELPKVPTIFAKFASSVIAPGQNIVLPKITKQPDYEAEMAVVIGPGGRYIAKDNWQAHVFGYTILNDVSARDIQLATTQWMMGKTIDTFCPIGPWIVTADEIPDPHTLNISLSIGGDTLQDSNTKHLIFDVPTLIEYLSSAFTLEPGDIISTGTPSGVGFARKPPRYLQAGDEVSIKIEKIGELRNPVVAEA